MDNPLENNTENNPKKLNVWLPLLFSVVMVAGMMLGMNLQKAPLRNVSANTQMPVIQLSEPGKVEELIRYIEARYVDKVDREKLLEAAIAEILKELDPHSNYITAKQLREVNEQLEGNFDGIGIEFMLLDDTILVVSPISGGPSEDAGILAGDKIITIEDSIVAGKEMVVNSIVEQLRGEKGSAVTIGILRGKETALRSFTIKRDEIPINSLDIAYMIDEKTGYFKLNRFSATTYKEFMKAMEVLINEHQMEDIIIDLRQNPGGYLQEATNILSQLFKEKDKLLVYTEGRTVPRNDYESTGRPFFNIGKVAVLIDEGSASASEIMAGAIQDWDRGVVVGRRSFGKGLVQEQYDLRDGSALRLTVARYYTPSGRSIQKDYIDNDHYNEDVIKRYESGELYNADSILVSDSTKFYTKKNKRVVFGGGGITPDYFVSLDSTRLNDYYLRIQQHIPQFIYRYLEKNQDAYSDYKINDFKQNFKVDDKILNELVDYALAKGLKKNRRQLNEARDLIKQSIKSRMGRLFYGEEGFYSIRNEDDPVINKALQLLKQTNPLSASKMK